MDTAQLVLTEGAKTQETQSLVPWIVGALVVVAVLYFIAKI